MCDNHHHALPCHNSFYYRYMQEHAALSYHFQKLHNMHNETPFYGMPCPGYVHNQTRYRSSCSSSSSSCSIRNSSGTSSSSVEDEGMNNEEYEDNDEDETEYEYELNVEAILAMRAAKEELKKQELKDEESAESNSKESSELKNESLDSQDETESKSDSIVIVESDNDESDEFDKDEFEFIGTCRNILGSNPFRSVCGFNKSEEARNRTKFMEYIYGSESNVVIALETTMNLTFQAYCDDLQPSFWPVLPLRL